MTRQAGQEGRHRSMDRFFVFLLLASLGVPAARAAVGSQSYAVTLEGATSAVLVAHPQLVGDAIELPARIEARAPAPVLLAGPLERAAASGNSPVAHIRIHCQPACPSVFWSISPDPRRREQKPRPPVRCWPRPYPGPLHCANRNPLSLRWHRRLPCAPESVLRW